MFKSGIAVFISMTVVLLTGGIHAIAQSKTQPSSLAEQRYQPEPYVPASVELYDTIVHLDSLYFDTYNTCNLEKMSTMMSDDIEFYHDRGGVSTSKKEILEGIKKNICGKVTRTLVKNSIEVYPIHDYGAVEIGYHSFHNNEEPDAPSKDSMFIVIWQRKDGNWKMTRVISLH
ncbi:MAG TPA: nuclear transport factor 2 family protein [Chitinophagales bacterium]|nr:nuclear transport factor 2 family protein [Chitinophagales bacterium]